MILKAGDPIITTGGRAIRLNGVTAPVAPAGSIGPTANYAFSGSGLTIAFQDTSTLNGGPAIVSWEWDFGDGSISNQQNPQHTFPAPGNYQVSLRVVDAAGQDSQYIAQRSVGPFTARGLSFDYKPLPASVPDFYLGQGVWHKPDNKTPKRPSRMTRLIQFLFPLLFLGMVASAQAQFQPLPLPPDNAPITATYLGASSDPADLLWSKTWDYGGGNIRPAGNIMSDGGSYPDSCMIAWIDTANGRTPGEPFIHSEMGIPFYDDGVTKFVFPNATDTFTLTGGANGFFRLHHSLLYELNLTGNRSAIHRDLSDTTRGRVSGVRNGNNSRIDHIVDPFLRPTSSIGATIGGLTYPNTRLDGQPIPTVRWLLFAMRPIYDSESVSFNWPGQDTGDYTNESTDGPHFAFNIWQAKGKFSGVVTMNLKWQGERLVLIIQDPQGNAVERPILIGPNAETGLTQNFSQYANQWLDFLVRMKPGFVVDGDEPGLDMWFRPADAANWIRLVDYSGDILSEIEAIAEGWDDQYGVPEYYLGLANGGIYPSTRLSGNALIEHWTPFRLSTPSRAFIKIDHSRYYYTEYSDANEPDTSSMFALANSVFPAQVQVSDTVSVDSFRITNISTTDSAATFTWPNVQGGDGYQLRVLDGGGVFYNSTAAVSPQTVTGMFPDSAYSAWVRVFPGTDPQDTVDIGGNFAQTATATFRTQATPAPMPPDAPDTLYVGGIDTTSAIIYFASVPGADTYILRIDSAGEVVQTIGGLTDTIQLVTGLRKATAYTVQVRATNANGAGDYSAPVAFSTATGNDYTIIIQKNGTPFLQYNIPQRAAEQYRLRLEADGAEMFNQSWTDQ